MYTYIYREREMYVCIYVYMYVYMYMCMYVYMYMYMYVYMYMYMYVYVYVCVYVYIYIHTRMFYMFYIYIYICLSVERMSCSRLPGGVHVVPGHVRPDLPGHTSGGTTCLVVFSNRMSLFSGIVQRIVTCPVDCYWNVPMNVQGHFPSYLSNAASFVVYGVTCLIRLNEFAA